jgi:IS5 family transposase
MNRELYTFADMSFLSKLKKIESSNVLARINMLIDWKRLESILSIVDRRNTSHTGPDCYAPISMFKILLLQSMYGFSDRQIEEQLNFNYLYIWFCGFSVDSRIPDYSTISRCRDLFIKNNVYELAFAEINSQLEEHGLSIKNTVIVDATLIESKSRPRKSTTIFVEPTGDEILDDASVNTEAVDNKDNVTVYETESKDPDARWLKKGKKSYFGYKNHVSVNKEGFINALITTPANVADTAIFPDLLEKVNPAKNTCVLADKGYTSLKNSELIKLRKLYDFIMQKKKKKQPVDDTLILTNKVISKLRYVVERTFGCMKRNLYGGRSWYNGLTKTHNFSLIRAIAHNMIRAVNYVVVQ